jgi:uncharacterized protein
VKDPREVVKAGDIVTVKVLSVDLIRKRIALTMRLTDVATAPAGPSAPREARPAARPAPAAPAPSTALGAAFSKMRSQ